MHPVLINGILIGSAMIAASATMLVAYEQFSPAEYAEVVGVTAAVDTVSAPREICTRSQADNALTTTYCHTVMEKIREPVGYDVSYRLGAKRGTVRMNHLPGQRIEVNHGELMTEATRLASNR